MTTRKTGIVAAGHRATAQAAADVLRAGGNAFDAAVGGIFAACMAEPVLASLGGGGFLMARPAGEDTCRLYDFFAHTPQIRRPPSETDFHEVVADFGPVQQTFHIGAGAAATPGLVPGLATVHRDLGHLSWRDVMQPACRLAMEGVVVTAFQAYLSTVVGPILTASPQAKSLFAPSGRPLAPGERFINPQLGITLGKIAEKGPTIEPDAALTQAILTQSSEHGGHLTPGDLANYIVEIRAPLHLNLAGQHVFLNPAPAAGGALIALGLAALEEQPACAETLLRAMEIVNTVRRDNGGDPQVLATHSILTRHLRQAAARPAASRGTTHISVIDGHGNAAAVTVSNGEGNGLMLGDTGVMLNNMLGEEDVLPDGLDSWPLDTRLSSMMAPTIVAGTDGAVTALGSGGSNRIRTALMQVIARACRDNCDLDTAVNEARMHLERDNTLSFEDFFSTAERASLLARYPDAGVWRERNMFFGGVHAVHRSADGKLSGAGDPRRDGVVIVVD